MTLGTLHGLEIEEMLHYGEGTCVYVARDPAGERFVLKRFVRRAGEDRRRIAQADREFEIGSQVRHPALRQSLARWRTPLIGRTRDVTLKLKYLDGPALAPGEVDDLGEAWALLAPVAGALQAMHAAGWMHGDLKPQNIVRHRGSTVLIDFALCRRIGETPERVSGTPVTMAPEQRDKRPGSAATDVFGLVATLKLLVGERYRDAGTAWAALLDEAMCHDQAGRPPLQALLDLPLR